MVAGIRQIDAGYQLEALGMHNRLPRTRRVTRTEEATTVGTPTGWREAMIPALCTHEQFPDSGPPLDGASAAVRLDWPLCRLC